MAFSLVSDARQSTPFETVRVASQAYTRGDAVMLDRTSDAVDVVPCTASSVTTNIYGVAAETVTSSATSLLIVLINPDQVWNAEVANTASSNHNMMRAIFTDANTINNTGTDVTGNTGVFLQTGVIDSTHIAGKFMKSAGVT